MANSLQHPWPGASWTDLDIAKNCSLYGSYASWIMSDGGEPDMPTVLEFWRSVVTDDKVPSGDEIVKWHDWAREHRYDLQSGLPEQLSKTPSCRQDLCLSIQPDVPESWVRAFPKLETMIQLCVHHADWSQWVFSMGALALFVTLQYITTILYFFHRRKHLNGSEKVPQAQPKAFLHKLYQACHGESGFVLYWSFWLSLTMSLICLVIVFLPRQWYGLPWYAFASSTAFFLAASTVPIILPATKWRRLKHGTFVAIFLFSSGSWVVNVDRTAESFMPDADILRGVCPYALPSTGAIQATLFATAGTVWMPLLFGLCLAFVLQFFYRGNSRAMWQNPSVITCAKAAAMIYGAVHLVAFWAIWAALAKYTAAVPSEARPAWKAWKWDRLCLVIPSVFPFLGVILNLSEMPTDSPAQSVKGPDRLKDSSTQTEREANEKEALLVEL